MLATWPDEGTDVFSFPVTIAAGAGKFSKQNFCDLSCRLFLPFSILYFKKKTLFSVLHSEDIFVNQIVKSVVLWEEVPIKWSINLTMFRFPPMYQCKIYFLYSCGTYKPRDFVLRNFCKDITQE